MNSNKKYHPDLSRSWNLLIATVIAGINNKRIRTPAIPPKIIIPSLINTTQIKKIYLTE